VLNRLVRAVVGLGAVAGVVVVTTAAGMRGNPGPANDVVQKSASGSSAWIVAGVFVGVCVIAGVFVRRRRREHADTGGGRAS
jgi:hypothetical protein